MSFKPAWWLTNPHAQTLWPSLFRQSIKNLALRRERFELPDGDFIDLDWVGNSGPIVIILHGLEGSVKSSYAQGMLHTIQKNNWRGVLMHFRSCSGERNRLPRIYHSGDTKDLEALVLSLKQREPHTPVGAIGFSLGGNVLLKWLGETGEKNPLSAAIAISVPFELQKAALRINQGFSKLYQWHLLTCLVKKIHWKFGEQHKSLSPRTMEDFDNQITAPLHGFKNAVDYYEKSSSRQFLKTISVPTLILHAKDDPFLTEDALPLPHELSKQITLEISENGGHVGFISGQTPWEAEYWLEQRVPLFLYEHL